MSVDGALLSVSLMSTAAAAAAAAANAGSDGTPAAASATPGDAVHAAMGRAAALAPLPAGMDSVQEAILSVTLDTFERPILGGGDESSMSHRPGGQAGGTAATAMMLQLPPPPPVPMPPWLDFRMVRAEIEANKAALDCATSTAVDVAMAAAAQPRRDAEAARDAAVSSLKVRIGKPPALFIWSVCGAWWNHSAGVGWSGSGYGGSAGEVPVQCLKLRVAYASRSMVDGLLVLTLPRCS